MTSLLSLKNILNFPSYAEQKPVLKMTYKALFDQPSPDFIIFLFSLSTTVPLASLTVLKFAPHCFHLRVSALVITQLEGTYPRYMLVHFPASSGVCSKDLFSTRSIVTIPLNIAIESFYPFPALFFCITLLPSNTLYTLLNYVVYYLFVGFSHYIVSDSLRPAREYIHSLHPSTVSITSPESTLTLIFLAM